jgi:hypothetical protein
MDIHSKYDFGDEVWTIYSGNREVRTNCTGCEGEGEISLADGTSVKCPKCYGKKYSSDWEPARWRVGRQLTIGQIRAEVTAPGLRTYPSSSEGIRYMCVETGVGSGTLYSEKDLFPNETLAELECEKRNAAQET